MIPRMRTTFVLLVLAALAAGEDRTPRDGSGWRGFAAGSYVRMKRTSTATGRTPAVTIWVTRLASAADGKLELETKAENALGMEEAMKTVVPETGEAAVGETEKTEIVGDERIEAAGKAYACKHVRTVVAQKDGTRTIDKWIAADPAVWVRRTEIRKDAAGKIAFSSSWKLKAVDAPTSIRERSVSCVTYDVVVKEGAIEIRSTLSLSRAVPGGMVREEGEILQDGKRVQTYLVEVLDVEVK
jgi:hypothetical protein